MRNSFLTLVFCLISSMAISQDWREEVLRQELEKLPSNVELDTIMYVRESLTIVHYIRKPISDGKGGMYYPGLGCGICKSKNCSAESTRNSFGIFTITLENGDLKQYYNPGVLKGVYSVIVPLSHITRFENGGLKEFKRPYGLQPYVDSLNRHIFGIWIVKKFKQ